MSDLAHPAFDNLRDKRKFVEFREHYRITGNISKSCRETGTSENTARKWRDKGLLDLDDYELQARAVMAVGPEIVEQIIHGAAENLLAAQDRVAATVHLAPPAAASRIAVEQFNIFQVARGQATEILELKTAEDVSKRLNALLPVDDVIEGEVVEQADAA